jgi:hypothetical protein
LYDLNIAQRNAKTPMSKVGITPSQFTDSLAGDAPVGGLSIPLTALWWDAKGDWAKAHTLVNDLDTTDAMAVHAYLHRKEGDAGNTDYWYARAGRSFHRPTLEAEWKALVEGLLAESAKG